MTTKFDWDQFQDVPSDAPPTATQEDIDWNQFQDVPTTKSTAQQSIGTDVKEAFKGLGRISGRGAASLLAAPSKGIGGILELLSKIYPEDEGPRGAPRKSLESAGRFLQEIGEGGQEQLKGLVEDVLGKSYGSGEEALAEFTERAADIYGRGPLKGMGAPSVIGGASGQIAKELGASEGIQEIAELIGIGVPDAKKAVSALKSVEKIKEKSGLILPRVVEKTKDGFKLIKGKVFPKAKEKAYEKVSKQAEELINSMKASEFPLSVEIEKGIDVESRVKNDLEKVNKIAAKMDHKVETNLIYDYLNNVEEKIRGGAPVPSKEQEEILGLVSKYKKKYAPKKTSTINISDPDTFSLKFEGKRFYTPSEYVQQFRNINADAKILYERAFFEGKKGKVREFYTGLNKEFEKTLEIGTPEAFSNLFKETNAQFHELQKMKTFEHILEEVTTKGMLDSKKLRNIFRSSSKSKLLRKQVGPESFEQMRLISSDLEKVQDKLGLLKEMGFLEIAKSTAVGGLLKSFGLGKGAVPLIAGKKGAELSYGYFLLNPKGQRDFRNFLKSLQTGNKKAVERYLKTMDKHALEEEKRER